MKFEEAYSLWKTQGGFLYNNFFALEAVIPESGTRKRRSNSSGFNFTKYINTNGGEWLKLLDSVTASRIHFTLSSMAIDDWNVTFELKPTPHV